MNQLSRNKILLIIIAVLLVSNVAMLVLFFRMNPAATETKRPGFSERLKKEVGFSEQQMSVYEPRRDAFWNSLGQRYALIKTTKEEFYSHMYHPDVPDSVLESKAEVIGKQQKDLDLYVIRHFKEVRKLCTPEQLPKYDSLLPYIIERMTARPKRK